LTGRLRKVNKERGDLQADLIAVKKEREQLALKMDAIRARHAQDARDEQERRSLVEGLRDIETAVNRGRRKMEDENREDEGFETNARQLLDHALQLVRGDGLFGTVKRWNTHLDEAIKAM
jgi:predicted RNase H-like nuclease (RuvC/YqgF family)